MRSTGRGCGRRRASQRLAAAATAVTRRLPRKRRRASTQQRARDGQSGSRGDGKAADEAPTNGSASCSPSEEDGESEESVELALDEDGRVGHHGPPLKYDFQHFTADFDAVDVQTLRRDCKVAFTARAKRRGDQYSAGKTFWVRADADPSTTLERLALAIFRHHAGHTDFDPARSGAEWWTQVIHLEDEIGWHWDRDYGLEEDTGFKLHPHIATVTYLSDTGAPTLVLHGAVEGPAMAVERVHVSWPWVGKHIAFDGRWLHGAPPDLADLAEAPAESTAKRRCTFLVNVWLNHKPVNAVPFKSLESALSTPGGDPPCMRFSEQSPLSMSVDSSSVGSPKVTRYSWRLHAGDAGDAGADGRSADAASAGPRKKRKSQRVVMHLPVEKLRRRAKRESGCSVSIDVAPGVALVGQPTAPSTE